MSRAGLRTRKYVTADGDISKMIVIEPESGASITIRLGVEEARALSAALKPNGRDIDLTGREAAA